MSQVIAETTQLHSIERDQESNAGTTTLQIQHPSYKSVDACSGPQAERCVNATKQSLSQNDTVPCLQYRQFIQRNLLQAITQHTTFALKTAEQSHMLAIHLNSTKKDMLCSSGTLSTTSNLKLTAIAATALIAKYKHSRSINLKPKVLMTACQQTQEQQPYYTG